MRLTRQKTDSIVGLAIEAGGIAATEVQVNGTAQVTASAVGSLEPGAFHEGEVLDPDLLAAALKSHFSEHKLSKRVRLGIGNQRVVTRSMRLPAIEDSKEMDAAVRFQAQEQIPMPLDQAVLEHQVVGGAPAEEGSTPQVDVVVVAARRDMVESFLEPLRRAGLEPVGIDLSAFAMIRALGGAPTAAGEGIEEPPSTILYCHLGDVANLAVARGRACLFARVSPVGLEAFSSRFATAANLSFEHAGQWLRHVGLEQPVEAIEGEPDVVAEARRTLEQGVGSLNDELRLSLDYYGAQEGVPPVERIVLCGPGGSVAGLAERMEASLGRPISVARPEALARFEAREAARLTLPYGLALED